MNVGELLAHLGECNEEATVCCIMQSEKDASIYDTVVIRTEEEKELVDIIVMNISGKGITVKMLMDDLKSYNANLPVCIKENRLKQIHFPYQVNGIKNNGDLVYLEIPKLMAGLFKE
ncbi:MAG: hypothetical protein ACFFDF_15955 [Candidatus Odinarchaeota archaeon]